MSLVGFMGQRIARHCGDGRMILRKLRYRIWMTLPVGRCPRWLYDIGKDDD